MKPASAKFTTSLLAAFLAWTVAVFHIDVQAIGPESSAEGFAAVNEAFHKLTDVHWHLYTLTDWLSLIPVAFVMGFAFLGAAQWFRRKHLLQVDGDILILGGFYLVVLGVYFFFEVFPVNYRPVLVEGVLEASYPSSTTVLVLCVMATATLQLKKRIKRQVYRHIFTASITTFSVLMILGRLISGVHWLTDIVGGCLLSIGLVLLYDYLSKPAE